MVIERVKLYLDGKIQNLDIDTPVIRKYYSNGNKKFESYYLEDEINNLRCEPEFIRWYKNGNKNRVIFKKEYVF